MAIREVQKKFGQKNVVSHPAVMKTRQNAENLKNNDIDKIVQKDSRFIKVYHHIAKFQHNQ